MAQQQFFFGGIHGNEAAGIFALKKVFEKINQQDVNGSFFGITGNLKALKKGKRFINTDLNRIWTEENLHLIKHSAILNIEEQEQYEIYEILREIIKSNKPPYYFIDLHTTSGNTLPFITINDALINRKFSKQFPVPVVLGIEEYLNGPLLSYINTLGYVSLGFESGQHEKKDAITNSIAFIYLSLVAAGILKKENVTEYQYYFNELKLYARNINDMFEVIYLYQLTNGENFKMQPNFESFQNIDKGTLLAQRNGESIISQQNARIFMPLYQDKGKEGFFLIKKINPFFLRLSVVLRRIKADNLLVFLPGISWQNKNKSTILVNLKIARYLAKSIFHLLGYRNKQIDETHLRLYNRERVSKLDLYKNLKWYKNNASY